MDIDILPDAKQILDIQITAILILDHNLTIHYANVAAQQLFLPNHHKLLGTSLTKLVDYISLDLQLLTQNMLKEQSITDNEVTVVISSQSHILALTAQPLSTDKFLMELFPLNTQRKLSKEQQQQAQQSAARDLIRGLAHEIKNPLSGLRGAAQLLDKALPSTELTEYTRVIIEQADRLRNLVDRLLGPQYPGQQSKQNIHQTIERVYKLLSLEKGENVTLIRDYDPSLPEFNYDAEQIEQVLLNIGRNALQALKNQHSHITFRTRTAFQEILHGKRYRLVARVDIEDDGPGIAPELQDIIFYPMVSGREEGTGLGLSIARNLIDQHSGKIEFNSWPGHTEFSVYLPIKK